MTVTDQAVGTRKSAALDTDIQRIKQRLFKMSNPELLRFGLTTKYKCAREPRTPDTPLLTIQLNEARTEWKRRNPTLPLNDSF
jgi:hypothetical protein